jgi:ATP-dependent DNA ligase
MLQLKYGWCTYEVFDMLFCEGDDIRRLPLVKRRDMLRKFLDKVYEDNSLGSDYPVEEFGPPSRNMFLIRHTEPGADYETFYQSIMSECGEGVIVKDLLAQYNAAGAWWKWKRRFEMDVVLTGTYDPAEYGKTGKFYGLGGAFYFGVYRKGQMLVMGKCSGMDDDTRTKMTMMADSGELTGKVITISGYEITQAGAIRNPNFEKWRPDKVAAECTYETQVVPNIRGG